VATLARTRPAETTLTELEAHRRDRVLAVLTYHRVDKPERRPDLYPGLISATPEAFEHQVDWLSRRFTVLSLAEARDALQARIPRRAMLLTFDDGYADFAQHAWPVLRAAGLPATLFVATAGAADDATRFWWDRLYDAVRRTDAASLETPIGRLQLEPARRDQAAFHELLARLKTSPHHVVLATVAAVERLVRDPRAQDRQPATLEWEALRVLEQEGVTIAPHTRSHPLLTRIPTREGRAEIEESRADLAANLANPDLEAFAYPSGAHDDASVALVRDLGMTLAFTTEAGLNHPASDRLRLRRFNVGWRSGPAVLSLRLVGSRLREQHGRHR